MREKTLDLEASPSVLIIFAANRFTRIWTRYLQRHFGLGAMEWRLMIMLTAEPDIPVTRISAVIDIDKAAVSRALARLETKGLATADVPEAYPHRRRWSLTPDGQRLHDQILAIALVRQDMMLDGVPAADAGIFVSTLQKVLLNLTRLEKADGEASVDEDEQGARRAPLTILD